MKRYLFPIYIALFLIGSTVLWYFGHHRPAQKILNAESKKVYKSTPLQSEGLSAKPTPSTQETSEADTDIKVAGIDNAATSEKIDDSQVQSEDTDSVEPTSQDALSAEDAAAAEAFEKYFTAEAEYQATRERLMEALTLNLDRHKEIEEALEKSDNQATLEGYDKVLDPKNQEQIWAAVEAHGEAQLRRKEAPPKSCTLLRICCQNVGRTEGSQKTSRGKGSRI